MNLINTTQFRNKQELINSLKVEKPTITEIVLGSLVLLATIASLLFLIIIL